MRCFMHDIPCVEFHCDLGGSALDSLVYDPTTPCRTLLPYQRYQRALH